MKFKTIIISCLLISFIFLISSFLVVPKETILIETIKPTIESIIIP